MKKLSYLCTSQELIDIPQEMIDVMKGKSLLIEKLHQHVERDFYDRKKINFVNKEIENIIFHLNYILSVGIVKSFYEENILTLKENLALLKKAKISYLSDIHKFKNNSPRVNSVHFIKYLLSRSLKLSPCIDLNFSYYSSNLELFNHTIELLEIYEEYHL